MKKILTILTVLICTMHVVAQSNIRLDNYWGHMSSITPAWIYDKYEGVFSMAAKKQWVGLEGAPTTLYASGSTYLAKYNAQCGISILQDKIGYTSLTSINLSYAYALNINYDWQIHFGIAGDYDNVSYDVSQVSLPDGYIDPVLFSKLHTDNDFDADLGVELSNLNLKVGFASQNVLDAFTGYQKLQTNTNFLYALYRQYDDNTVNWGGGVCGIEYAGIYQFEFNVTGYFKYPSDFGLLNKPDLFDIGVFYRTGAQAGLNIGYNISDNFYLTYSYGYHFGALGSGNYGTDQLMLVYRFKQKNVCHNCWY